MKAFATLAIFLATTAAQAANFKTVYDFQPGLDGSIPYSGVIKYGTSVCGTTTFGYSYGNIYCIDRKTGVETSLYSFQDGVDGGVPNGGLLLYRGKFYGTTTSAGQGGAGTVFVLDPNTNKLTTLYAFTNGADGGAPHASLIEVNGLLYSTTMTGGNSNLGTVFSIDPKTGKEKTVYQFTQQNAAGQPTTAPIAVGNVLYGTASGGNYSQGGVLYSINLSTGTEVDLAIIPTAPNASPVYYDGALWGTTDSGGSSGYGSIYRTDPKTGATKTVYSFDPFVTGAYASTALVVYNNVFYTAANSGGANNAGTIMSFNPKSGKGKALYAFTNGNDGGYPAGDLAFVNGRFYGTTAGGAGGYGAVFSIKP